jgi:hypothetical protein
MPFHHPTARNKTLTIHRTSSETNNISTTPHTKDVLLRAISTINENLHATGKTKN